MWQALSREDLWLLPWEYSAAGLRPLDFPFPSSALMMSLLCREGQGWSQSPSTAPS